MSRSAPEWEEDRVVEVRDTDDVGGADGWRPTDGDDGWGDHPSDVGAQRADRSEEVDRTDEPRDEQIAADRAATGDQDDPQARVLDARPESTDASHSETLDDIKVSEPELGEEREAPASVSDDGEHESHDVPDHEDESAVAEREAGQKVVDAESAVDRSEERRVGEECRSRWSSYH